MCGAPHRQGQSNTILPLLHPGFHRTHRHTLQDIKNSSHNCLFAADLTRLCILWDGPLISGPEAGRHLKACRPFFSAHCDLKGK